MLANDLRLHKKYFSPQKKSFKRGEVVRKFHFFFFKRPSLVIVNAKHNFWLPWWCQPRLWLCQPSASGSVQQEEHISLQQSVHLESWWTRDQIQQTLREVAADYTRRHELSWRIAKEIKQLYSSCSWVKWNDISSSYLRLVRII